MKLEVLNAKIPNAKNFTWSEALYLPSFNIHAVPNREVIKNIKSFAKKVQAVRRIIGKPMVITSWWRPAKYNVMIGGAKRSAHIDGIACDFIVPNVSADDIRKKLKPHLKRLGLRMENLQGSNWVHIDGKSTKGARFFRP